MNRRGAVLPLALFLAVACAMLATLFAEIGAAEVERQRAATACDFALLSALRVRREGLETIAARWDAFGGGITASGGSLQVSPALWPTLADAADALRRSVSGYQGRVTSSLTVALDANGFPRTASRVLTGTGLRLGVTAVTETVTVGAGTGALAGAWYRRGWSTGDAAPPATDAATLTLAWPLTWKGGDATVSAASTARLEWDVDPADPLAAAGRGGFARSTADALDGAAFTPHRFPLFRAALETAS